MEEPEGFAEFVLARSSQLQRSAGLLTGDWHAAHDLVQAALEKTWLRWDKLVRQNQPEAYVRRVMTTTYLAWRRRRWTGETPTSNLPETPADDSGGNAEDLRLSLLTALGRLTPRPRAVIVLRYFDDLSEADTAKALRCSGGTVKAQASRGLQQFREADVVALRRYDGTIASTIDVLADAGLLIEDVPTHVERYFTAKFIKAGGLPPLMRQHLDLWLKIMLGGSRQAPRRLPRDPATVRLHIMGIAPVVQTWVEAGHTSFGEITIDDVRDALVALSGSTRRHHAENGLKSLFKILKGRRLVFANPIKGLKVTPVATNIPLPLDSALVRAALDSPNPAVALAVALVAFHGLTGKQVRELRITDIADHRLLLGDRDIPLAAPVRNRVAAWLDHRNRTWPASANPHLLINRRTAHRLVAIGTNYPWTKSAVRPRAFARGPDPARDPRHGRQRTPHLRPVRAQRRRRHPLPCVRRAPRPDRPSRKGGGLNRSTRRPRLVPGRPHVTSFSCLESNRRLTGSDTDRNSRPSSTVELDCCQARPTPDTSRRRCPCAVLLRSGHDDTLVRVACLGCSFHTRRTSRISVPASVPRGRKWVGDAAAFSAFPQVTARPPESLRT
jgi:RNA polymerase sigma-70 factor (sigma-E family)